MLARLHMLCWESRYSQPHNPSQGSNEFATAQDTRYALGEQKIDPQRCREDWPATWHFAGFLQSAETQ